jgi:hypothetical protein
MTRHAALALVLALLPACTRSGPSSLDVEPRAPAVQPSVAPIEAEPARELPPIVAPPLPELAPTRPLGHLAPLWRQGDGPPPTTILALGRTPLALPLARAQALGLSDAHVELARLERRSLQPYAWAGSLLLLGDERGYAGATTSSELAWLREITVASYTFAISPRMLIAGLYGSGRDDVAAWALADGSEQWTRADDPEFSRISLLAADAERAYLLGDAGLVALDPDSGATRWTASRTSSGCGVALGEGVVVLEDPSGHLVLDAASGSLVTRVAALEPGTCGWMGMGEVAPAQVRDGLFVAFDTTREQSDAQLRAIELDTGTQRWVVEGLDAGVLILAADAVYVARGRSLVALDLAAGHEQAAVAIGGGGFVAALEPVGGAAGPLLALTDAQGRTTIVGRAEQAPTREHYEIRGQLVADPHAGPTSLAGVRVRIGDTIVTTDAKGRFKARGEATGVIEVGPAADPYAADYDVTLDGEQPIAFEPLEIELVGKGKYELGKLTAWEQIIA